jgi:sugar/nucleoside kinase (ribokinase family)
MSASEPSARRPVLCLGEALVDLVCERPVASMTQADAFVPRAGGALANVALVAARAGAQVAVAGGAGQDSWGAWLREALRDAGVDISLFALVPGVATQLAFVTVDGRGEPAYTVHGDGLGAGRDAVLAALAPRLADAVAGCAALFITSNTLVGAGEREVTMRARSLASEHELPIIFDANVRLHRWRSAADAAASSNALVPGALLVRLNEAEATLLTGEDDPERAALALVKAGARLVVITLGPDGAMLRGELRADVDGVPAQVLSTMGAGDVFTGTLLARLALSDFYPPAVAASLRDAVQAAARACERWGAVD